MKRPLSPFMAMRKPPRFDVSAGRCYSPGLAASTELFSIRSRRWREADGRLSLLSPGMKQFELPDLLLIAPSRKADEALPMFYDLLDYVISRGRPLPFRGARRATGRPCCCRR